MKVLHCITGLSGDGAQRMLFRLVGGLHQEGVGAYVVNLGASTPLAEEFSRLGVAVQSMGLSAVLSDVLVGGFRMSRLIDSLRPDIVQGWMYHANILALIAVSVSRHKPLLAWNVRRGLDDFAERSFKTRAVVRANSVLSRIPRQIIYCSGESRTQHEAFGFYAARGCVLPNGFDTQRFRPSVVSRLMFRRAYGIGDEEIVLGNVGRFDLAKGHMYLLEAFSEALRQVPTARLVLLGRGVEQSNRRIADTLQRLNIADRVLLLGERESLENIYSGFDLYCSASLNEGFPNALSEAMACGVPCVATDTGASRRLVDGIGRVVPPRRPHDLAAAIVQLASLPASQRQQLGSQSRTRIEARYSLHSVVRQYREVYSDLAAQAHPR